jgi:hypothetical protein
MARAKNTYRVVGDSKIVIDGKDVAKGDEFKSDMTDEQAAALIEGGHIKAIDAKKES